MLVGRPADWHKRTVVMSATSYSTMTWITYTLLRKSKSTQRLTYHPSTAYHLKWLRPCLHPYQVVPWQMNGPVLVYIVRSNQHGTGRPVDETS